MGGRIVHLAGLYRARAWKREHGMSSKTEWAASELCGGTGARAYGFDLQGTVSRWGSGFADGRRVGWAHVGRAVPAELPHCGFAAHASHRSCCLRANILHAACNWAMLDIRVLASFCREGGVGRIGMQGPQRASSGRREWTLQPSERASGETDPSMRCSSLAYRARLRSRGETMEAETSGRLGISMPTRCTPLIPSRLRLAAY